MPDKFHQRIALYLKKRRRRLLIIGLFLACLVYIGWPNRPSEPTYQGRTLTYWLEHYIPPATNIPSSGGFLLPDPQAVEAIRQIGTNAIPTLLQLARAHDSNLKLRFIALARKQPWVAVRYTFSWDKNSRAMRGFGELRSAASNAVPSLIEILNANFSPSSQQTAVSALGAIGPPAREAVPSLVRMLSDTNTIGYARYTFLRAIGEIHAEPQLAVPVLIKCLGDPHPDVRSGAAEALGKFGADAEPAVPALIEVCEGNSAESLLAASSLGRIGPAARKAVPTLLSGLADTKLDSEFRLQCIRALGRIHADSEMVVPALRKAIENTAHDDDVRVRSFSAEALGQFGSDARPAIPALMSLLRDSNVNVRLAATNALLQVIEPTTTIR